MTGAGRDWTVNGDGTLSAQHHSHLVLGIQCGGGGGSSGVDGLPLDATCFFESHTGKTVQCADESGRARCANTNKQAFEQLRIKRRDDGNYIITSLRNGKNLQCQPNGHVQFANKNEQLWEFWAVEKHGGKYFFVSQHTKKVLQCRPDGGLSCANENRQGYEAFQLLR